MIFYMIKIKQILTITGLLHPYLLINTANGICQIRYLLPLQVLLVKFLQIDRRCKVAVLLLKRIPVLLVPLFFVTVYNSVLTCASTCPLISHNIAFINSV